MLVACPSKDETIVPDWELDGEGRLSSWLQVTGIGAWMLIRECVMAQTPQTLTVKSYFE